MPGASTPPAPPCGPDSGQSTRRPKRSTLHDLRSSSRWQRPSNSARGLCKGPLLLGRQQRLPNLPRPRLLTTRTPPAQLRNIRIRRELASYEALALKALLGRNPAPLLPRLRRRRQAHRTLPAVIDPLEQRTQRPRREDVRMDAELL